MTSRTEIDTDVLADHISAVINWADAETLSKVSDEDIIKAALKRADVDPGDVVILTYDDADDAPPLCDRVIPADGVRQTKESLAECASEFVKPLRKEAGYDTLELDRMTDAEICRAFMDEVRARRDQSTNG